MKLCCPDFRALLLLLWRVVVAAGERANGSMMLEMMGEGE